MTGRSFGNPIDLSAYANGGPGTAPTLDAFDEDADK